MTNEELVHYARWLLELLNVSPLSEMEEQYVIDMYREELEEVEEEVEETNVLQFPNAEEVK